MKTFSQHFLLTEASFDKSQKLWLPMAQRLVRDSSGTEQTKAASRVLRKYANEILGRKVVEKPGEDPPVGYEDVEPTLPQEAVKPLEDWFNYLQNEVDPTRGKYVVWMISRYVKPVKAPAEGEQPEYGIQRAEDFDRARMAIERHAQAVNKKWFTKPENEQFKTYSDINRFKDLPDLEVFLRDHVKFKEEETKDLTDEEIFELAYKHHKELGGFKEFLNQDGIRVIRLLTVEASSDMFFKRTSWCTATPKSNFFKSYTDKGFLIVTIDVNPASPNLRYVQAEYSPTGRYFLDAQDRNFNWKDWLTSKPAINEGNKIASYSRNNPMRGLMRIRSGDLKPDNAIYADVVKAIASEPKTAYDYAVEIIKQRWPDGEAAIKKKPELWDKYTAKFNVQEAKVTKMTFGTFSKRA